MFVNPAPKKGFTLVELLVAISVLAILSMIGLTVYSFIQSKARDGVRRTDLNNLATALEIYAQKNGKYITGENTCQTDIDALYQTISPGSGSAPHDPQPGNSYCYIPVSNGTSFILCAKLEQADNSEANGCPTNDYNYGVVPK